MFLNEHKMKELKILKTILWYGLQSNEAEERSFVAGIKIDNHREQAGAELSQAQPQLW